MYFYDTCALLNMQEAAFYYKFKISHVTLKEIEDIKTSRHKDDEVKYKARNMARLLKENQDIWEVVRYSDTLYEFETLTPDEKIYNDFLYAWNDIENGGDYLVFVTDDLNLYNISVSDVRLDVCDSSQLLMGCGEYTGWQHFDGDDKDLATFFADLTVNTQNLEVNEYVFVPEIAGGMSGYRWTGDEYQLLYSRPLKTRQFGDDFRARDIYQRAAIDSIMNNDITCLAGPAGCGKSLISLVCAFNLIERGLYDRIVMLINPTKVRGATEMGFYPGTAYEKITESFAGHMLGSKLGDRFEIDRLVEEDKMRLISMADIRGMEIRAGEILYISECQNTSADLMKLCLSRVCDGAKVIFEGDFRSQVDSVLFMGKGNGMRRAIEVLKGSHLFGYVELKQVWRSELAALIENM